MEIESPTQAIKWLDSQSPKVRNKAKKYLYACVVDVEFLEYERDIYRRLYQGMCRKVAYLERDICALTEKLREPRGEEEAET